jgi:hypothetical protein
VSATGYDALVRGWLDVSMVVDIGTTALGEHDRR